MAGENKYSMNKAKSGLARKNLKQTKKTLWVLIQRKKIHSKPVLHPQPEYSLEFSTFFWSPRNCFSLLSSFTALGDREQTLERVVTGKQKHGAEVTARLTEVEQSKHSEQADHDSWLTYTAHSSPPPKPGCTHQSRRPPDFTNNARLSQ